MEPIKVSFPELVNQIGGAMGFSLERMIQMISSSDDLNKDFIIHHGDTTYVVPLDSIREFFTKHEKPKRPMSMKEENAVLKSRLELMEAELLALKGKSLEPKTKFIPQGSELLDLERPSSEEGSQALPDLEPQKMEEIRGELAAELRGKKPVNPKGMPDELKVRKHGPGLTTLKEETL